ncbi:MAG TPA: preprotein translocase subunit SecG [Gemmatimonas sp.]|nr:preprotein translocase subunit SecG [Gemmatimonas sp.]
MYTFLLTLLIIDALVLGAAVLLQSGKGGGLAANFGGASSSSDSVIGTRQAGNLLTKASWWCGGVFLTLSFILQLMSSRSAAPKSVLDQLATPAQSSPAAPAGANAPAPAAPLTTQPAGSPAAAPASTPPTTAPAVPPAAPPNEQ